MEPTIFKPRLKFKPPRKFFKFGHCTVSTILYFYFSKDFEYSRRVQAVFATVILTDKATISVLAPEIEIGIDFFMFQSQCLFEAYIVSVLASVIEIGKVIFLVY